MVQLGDRMPPQILLPEADHFPGCLADPQPSSSDADSSRRGVNKASYQKTSAHSHLTLHSSPRNQAMYATIAIGLHFRRSL